MIKVIKIIKITLIVCIIILLILATNITSTIINGNLKSIFEPISGFLNTNSMMFYSILLILIILYITLNNILLYNKSDTTCNNIAELEEKSNARISKLGLSADNLIEKTFSCEKQLIASEHKITVNSIKFSTIQNCALKDFQYNLRENSKVLYNTNRKIYQVVSHSKKDMDTNIKNLINDCCNTKYNW